MIAMNGVEEADLQRGLSYSRRWHPHFADRREYAASRGSGRFWWRWYFKYIKSSAVLVVEQRPKRAGRRLHTDDCVPCQPEPRLPAAVQHQNTVCTVLPYPYRDRAFEPLPASARVPSIGRMVCRHEQGAAVLWRDERWLSSTFPCTPPHP